MLKLIALTNATQLESLFSASFLSSKFITLTWDSKPFLSAAMTPFLSALVKALSCRLIP
jgi:hypothetical protein